MSKKEVEIKWLMIDDGDDGIDIGLSDKVVCVRWSKGDTLPQELVEAVHKVFSVYDSLK